MEKAQNQLAQRLLPLAGKPEGSLLIYEIYRSVQGELGVSHVVLHGGTTPANVTDVAGFLAGCLLRWWWWPLVGVVTLLNLLDGCAKHCQGLLDSLWVKRNLV